MSEKIAERPFPLPTHSNLTVREVALFLRVSQGSVYDQVATELLPSVRVGRQIRIPRKDFLVWYEKKPGG